MTFTPPKPRPQPKTVSWFGAAKLGLASSLTLLMRGSYSPGVGRFSIPTLPRLKKRWLYTIRNADIARSVMIDRAEAFPKGQLMRPMMADLAGENVLSSAGETWKRKRRMMAPAFEAARIRDVFPQMADACAACLTRLDAQVDRKVDIDAEMTHVTADVIHRTIFSAPIDERDARRIFRLFQTFQDTIYGHGMLALAKAPSWILPSRVTAFLAGKRIRAFLARALATRLRAGERPDLLAALVAARDPETGEAFSSRELLDEIAMLFLAGHETTASALAWSLYLLAGYPEHQARLRREVRDVAGDRPITFADMRRLSFTRDAFRETLRLYPPVAFIARDAIGQQTLGERTLEPEAAVFISPWLIHRQECHWRDPDSFDPDRFSAPEAQPAVRTAFIPFGLGPRVCVGASFALQEGVLLLAEVVRRFQFDLTDEEQPEPISRLTLRSANGIRLRLSRAA